MSREINEQFLKAKLVFSKFPIGSVVCWGWGNKNELLFGTVVSYEESYGSWYIKVKALVNDTYRNYFKEEDDALFEILPSELTVV